MPGPRPSYDLGPARAVVGRTPVLAVDRIKLLYQLAKTCVNATTREAGALRVCLQGCLAYARYTGFCTVRIHIVHRVHRCGRARTVLAPQPRGGHSARSSSAVPSNAPEGIPRQVHGLNRKSARFTRFTPPSDCDVTGFSETDRSWGVRILKSLYFDARLVVLYSLYVCPSSPTVVCLA